MKTPSICALTGMLLALTAGTRLIAQTDRPDTTFPGQGSWALQFGIGSNFSLTSIQGATIALQYHCTESNALRFRITLNGNISDETNLDLQGSTGSMLGQVSTNRSSNVSSVALTAQYLWYIRVRERVRFYGGAGPVLQYAHSSTQNETISQASDGTNWNRSITTISLHQWGAGAAGAVGVQWFVTSWCSLSAEYGVALRFDWSSTESTLVSASWPGAFTNNTSGEGKTKGWSLGNTGTNFSLSVYF